MNSRLGLTTTYDDTNVLYFNYPQTIFFNYNDYVTLAIKKATIPVSWYNVNVNNYSIFYTISSVSYTAILTKQQENVNTLITNVVAAFAVNGHTLTMTYSSTKNYYTYSMTSSFTILSTTTADEIMGLDFTNGNLTSTGSGPYTLTSNRAVDVSYTKNIFVKGYPFSSKMQFGCNSDPTDDGRFAVIPVTVNFPGIILQNDETSENEVDVSSNFSEFTISLLDDSGQIIEMNNGNWVIVLEFRVYENPIVKKFGLK